MPRSKDSCILRFWFISQGEISNVRHVIMSSSAQHPPISQSLQEAKIGGLPSSAKSPKQEDSAKASAKFSPKTGLTPTSKVRKTSGSTKQNKGGAQPSRRGAQPSLTAISATRRAGAVPHGDQWRYDFATVPFTNPTMGKAHVDFLDPDEELIVLEIPELHSTQLGGIILFV